MAQRSGCCWIAVAAMFFALVASQSAAWFETSWISGCFRQDVADALHLVDACRSRQHALGDGHFAAAAIGRCAFVDEALADLFAHSDIIGAHEDVGRVARAHIDLHHIDAGLLRLLQQSRVGLHIRIVHDDDIRLLRDERGDRLGAGVGAPIGVADLEGDAERFQRLLEAGSPAFGQVETHGHRHVGHALTGEQVVVRRTSRVVDTLLRCSGAD